MDAITLVHRESPDARCALCHDALDDESAVCPGCGTVLHRDCRALLMECPTLGCRQSTFSVIPPTAGARPLRVRPGFRRALANLAARERQPDSGARPASVLVERERAGSEGASERPLYRLAIEPVAGFRRFLRRLLHGVLIFYFGVVLLPIAPSLPLRLALAVVLGAMLLLVRSR